MNKKTEAGNGITGPKSTKILGIGISGTDKEGLLNEINSKVSKNTFARPFFIITAYSENMMEADRDAELARAFSLADRVVADGVSVLAAAEYLKNRSGNTWQDLWLGFGIGGKILRGKYADKRISGVKLTEELLSQCRQKQRRVCLLGGKDGEAEKLAKRFGETVSYCEPPMGMKIEDRRQTEIILKKVSEARPDILLVGLGRFKQEKWIAQNLKRLRAKVVMGVGSSFDELAGEGAWSQPTPAWIDRMGLKWLWRAIKDPRHIRRAWNAFPVFAWKVFRSTK